MHGTFNKTSVILVYVLSRTIKQVTVQPLKSLFTKKSKKARAVK